jgi:hypothetical protein
LTKKVGIRKDEEGKLIFIPACASSVVELWFAAADFPKDAVGADVVTKAALLALYSCGATCLRRTTAWQAGC